MVKPWDTALIGDFLDFKNGLNKGKEFFGYGTPIVNYTDVYKNRGLKKADIRGKVCLTPDEIHRFDVRKNDVFFTRTSETPDEVGMSSVLLEDVENGVFSGFVLRGRPKNVMFVPEYCKYCFSTETVRNAIITGCTYTTRALTNGKQLSAIKMPVPPKPEQEAIAAALSDIDTLIVNLEKLIAKKKAIKRGAMQELLTGKRRLPGFDGAWKASKIGDFGVFVSGSCFPLAHQGRQGEKYPFYKVSDFNNPGNERYLKHANFIDTEIEILGRRMPIRVIDNYKVAIRPVEFEDFSRILNMPKVNTGTIEYNSMMEYLTVSGMSLTELVAMNDEYYDAVKTEIQNLSRSNNLFNSLDRCRQLIRSAAPGSNILRYILLKMRHHIMRYQIADRPNNWISYLCLWNECLPFDSMPFDASLVYHNPSFFDVFSCISSKGREHEILSRKIRINTEQNMQLFTPTKDVEYIGDVEELANKFNSLLIPKHVPVRSLVIEKDKVYIKGYEADTVSIINDLISRVGSGLTGYRNAMDAWLQATPAVDCAEKKTILLDMFSKYDLALIYGAAGTGKTTLITHLSSYFADSSKLFLANTNPAKENLRRQIKVSNSEFSTIASCAPLVNGRSYDIVFIDECSTVDNAAMKDLLKRLHCRLLVLVGDVYQIRSIKFGNWFSLARYFLSSDVIYELNTPYRSKHSSMVDLWNKVRLLDERTEEYIALQNYASELDDSIFVHEDLDEIILCLNYDGLYGINNINRFLQNDNPNPAVYWDSWIYKEFI